MGILQRIMECKKKEIQTRLMEFPINVLKQKKQFNIPKKSLATILKNNVSTGIIAEFKRKSPSKGIIHNNPNLAEITQSYFNNHAAGISILTDEQFFGGTLLDLEQTAQLSIPVLRKDFMIDAYQIYEAKAYGASVVLLIAACLDNEKIIELARIAKDIDLEVLLEIHQESELLAINEWVDIIGINNRNLDSLELDIQTSINLYPQLQKYNKPIISESGIHNLDTLKKLKKIGFNGFLIGENFMKQEDPAQAFADFVENFKTENEN